MFAIGQRLVHIGRKHVSDNNEAILGMDFVSSIIEGVTLIYSMEDCSLDVSSIIVDKSDLEIVVSLGSNHNILHIKMRIVSGFHVADGKESSINWHMEVILLKELLNVDEGSSKDGNF